MALDSVNTQTSGEEIASLEVTTTAIPDSEAGGQGGLALAFLRLAARYLRVRLEKTSFLELHVASPDPPDNPFAEWIETSSVSSIPQGVVKVYSGSGSLSDKSSWVPKDSAQFITSIQQELADIQAEIEALGGGNTRTGFIDVDFASFSNPLVISLDNAFEDDNFTLLLEPTTQYNESFGAFVASPKWTTVGKTNSSVTIQFDSPPGSGQLRYRWAAIR